MPNLVEFKQALSTHELYQLEGNTYLLESTFTEISIENLCSWKTFYFIEINLEPLLKAGFVEA